MKLFLRSSMPAWATTTGYAVSNLVASINAWVAVLTGVAALLLLVLQIIAKYKQIKSDKYTGDA